MLQYNIFRTPWGTSDAIANSVNHRIRELNSDPTISKGYEWGVHSFQMDNHELTFLLVRKDQNA